MMQYNIKVLNYPDPLADEVLVTKAVDALARARAWSETAMAFDLENLLYRSDRAGFHELVRKIRARRILTPDVAEDVRWLADACSKRIATLMDYDAPATRAKANWLNESASDLHALADKIDQLLDLEKALDLRGRINRATEDERT